MKIYIRRVTLIKKPLEVYLVAEVDLPEVENFVILVSCFYKV